MSAMLTPLVGTAALAEDWLPRPALLHRYERRETPITLPEIPVPMAALLEGDSDGVPLSEIQDEPTIERCGLCGRPLSKHWGVCSTEEL